jgi:hypothetical protein
MVDGMKRILSLLCAALLVLGTAMSAAAFDVADNDDFYLGLGSSNIEVKDSEGLLSGSNALGGVRFGLFWTFFAELGYGAIRYNDKVRDSLTGNDIFINFRTTGAHYGVGFLIPIRAINIGWKFQRSPNNRWNEEVNEVTPVGDPVSNLRKSGKIDFDSYFAFARFGESGWFEVGARRDLIKSTDSLLTNSFGPYLMFNLTLN